MFLAPINQFQQKNLCQIIQIKPQNLPSNYILSNNNNFGNWNNFVINNNQIAPSNIYVSNPIQANSFSNNLNQNQSGNSKLIPVIFTSQCMRK